MQAVLLNLKAESKIHVVRGNEERAYDSPHCIFPERQVAWGTGTTRESSRVVLI